MDLIKTMALIKEVAEKTNKMNSIEFGGFIAMVVEEWCAVNEECTPKEFFADLARIAGVVESELGRYKP